MDSADVVYPLNLPLNEWCRLRRVSRSQAYRLLNAGKIKAKKLGTRTVITAESDHAFVASLPDYEPRQAA